MSSDLLEHAGDQAREALREAYRAVQCDLPPSEVERAVRHAVELVERYVQLRIGHAALGHRQHRGEPT